MNQQYQPDHALNWLLDDLAQRLAEIRHAVVLSGDGLPVAASSGLDREERERFAAIASGFHSLAKGSGRSFGAGGVVSTLVELEGGFLFVVAAGDRSCLAVFGEADADLGLVGYEMARLVKQVNEHLSVASRQQTLAAGASAGASATGDHMGGSAAGASGGGSAIADHIGGSAAGASATADHIGGSAAGPVGRATSF